MPTKTDDERLDRVIHCTLRREIDDLLRRTAEERQVPVSQLVREALLDWQRKVTGQSAI